MTAADIVLLVLRWLGGLCVIVGVFALGCFMVLGMLWLWALLQRIV